MAGPARQKRDSFVLNIEGEPTTTDRANADGISLPAPQFATAVTEDDELVIELDDYFQFRRGISIELDTSVERSVCSSCLCVVHGHPRHIGA